MLGTRTRHVVSYGRRGHRIVNASEGSEDGAGENKRRESTLSFRFAPQAGGRLIESTSKSAYSGQTPPSSPSSSEVSEFSSPEPTLKNEPHITKTKVHNTKKRTKTNPNVRRPLTPVPTNVLSGTTKASPSSLSPFAVQNKPKPRKISGNGTLLKHGISLKPVSPVVHVEIIVLDDSGKQVDIEKRTTKPTVSINCRNSRKSQIKPSVSLGLSAADAIDVSDSDNDDYRPPVRRTRKTVPAVRRVVLSSDNDSDIEVVSIRQQSSANPSSQSPSPGMRPLAKRKQNVIVSLPQSSASVLSSSHTQESLCLSPPKPKVPKSVRTPIEESRPQVPKAAQSNPTTQIQKPFSQSLRAVSPPDLAQASRSKPRPLTPIRSRASFLPPPSPPSPTILSDLEESLAFDFSELALSPGTLKELGGTSGLDWETAKQPAYLRPLLEECGQDAPHEFSAFIELFPFDPIVQTSHDGVHLDAGLKEGAGTRAAFRKIGEASYSEVFGIGDVVLKIIPLRNEEAKKNGRQVANESECPAPSDAQDVLKEIIVTKAMGQTCTGFVELLRTYVVRGKYPSLLLDLWDEYHERKGSESVRPGTVQSILLKQPLV
jgi:serine/threonine-protein kinase haspin